MVYNEETLKETHRVVVHRCCAALMHALCSDAQCGCLCHALSPEQVVGL